MPVERPSNVNLCKEAGCSFACCCRWIKQLDLEGRDEFPGALDKKDFDEVLSDDPNAKVARIIDHEAFSIMELPTGRIRKSVYMPNGCIHESKNGCSIYENRPTACRRNKRGGPLCNDSRAAFNIPPIASEFKED